MDTIHYAADQSSPVSVIIVRSYVIHSFVSQYVWLTFTVIKLPFHKPLPAIVTETTTTTTTTTTTLYKAKQFYEYHGTNDR